ncbi:MAG: AAA family ATPase [Candidatus Micrarchaeota archaeon]|nr:AAA family ATPase [Candidatus Micrarchaeota archaeon]
MEDRVKTGIAGLDELIEGGFNRGQVISVSGASGSGKTTLAVQFLVNGANIYNEPGLYITLGEQKKQIFTNMLRYGWDLKKLEEERKILFVEYPPYEIEVFLSQEVVIRDSVEMVGVKRLVIDPVSSLLMGYGDEQKRRERLLRLLERLRSLGCTSLMTSESAGIENEVPLGKFEVELFSDGIIYLYNMRRKNERQRALEVIKLRGTKHSNRMCPIEFTDHGIEVYTNKEFKEF